MRTAYVFLEEKRDGWATNEYEDKNWKPHGKIFFDLDAAIDYAMTNMYGKDWYERGKTDDGEIQEALDDLTLGGEAVIDGKDYRFEEVEVVSDEGYNSNGI